MKIHVSIPVLRRAVLIAAGLITSVVTAADEIDLLAKLDPNQAGTVGTWTKTSGELSVKAVNGARIALPWTPTSEYDFEVEFTRHSGSDSIAQIFIAGGRQATFDIDGWGQHLAGIQNIGGQTMRDNATRVNEITLQNGRRYTAMLRVRRDRVEALLNHRVLATYRGTGADLSLLKLWSLPQQNSLGLGVWNSAATFHRVTARPAAGSPSTIPPSTPETQPQMVGRNLTADAAADIAALSDEFDKPSTLRNWRRVFQTEQSGADQLATFDIGRSRQGWLTMIPHTSTWYQDYRGVLAWKPVAGNFVVTTRVRATSRSGNGAPRSDYSLAGLMVRTPRDVTPRTWRPGGENYIFLSLGTARNPGSFQFEVKTTVNSRSDLEVTPAGGPEAVIQVVRIGSDFVLLKKDGTRPWEVHRRYRRPDMPGQLQIGLTVYTDYSTAARLQPAQQNTQVIHRGNPDLNASFDFVRFRRPEPPAAWQGRSIADGRAVPDAVLLQVFGEHAM